MRRFLFVMAIVAILCGCDPAFGINTKGYHHLCQSLDAAWRHTSSFKYEKDNKDYWKSPIEFEEDGCGDCEDFATDLMYYLGEDSNALRIQFYGKASYHMIVKYRGLYIEPQTYGKYYTGKEFIQKKIWSYEAAMRECTKWGTKNIK